jgi:hypothetical protein
VISITFDNISPKPTPINDEAVNYETLFPDISPILFLFANLMLILALEAEDNRKHTFFPTLAIEASIKK